MSKFAINEGAETELQDLHRGLHRALDELENRKNHQEAITILKQLDLRMVRLINDAVVVGP